MTDAEREQAIELAKEAMRRAAETGNWKLARQHQNAMLELIRGRSELRVAVMEQERGLT